MPLFAFVYYAVSFRANIGKNAEKTKLLLAYYFSRFSLIFDFFYTFTAVYMTVNINVLQLHEDVFRISNNTFTQVDF